MMITEKTQDTAKTSEANPLQRPTETESAVTNAECALGMPPAEMNQENAGRRSRTEYNTTLNAWQATWTPTAVRRLTLRGNAGAMGPSVRERPLLDKQSGPVHF